MNFSIGVEYAVHSLMYLSLVSPGKTTLLSEIAAAVKVTESYLRKVFPLLSKSGIVVSHRGAKGGYYLAREAKQITLKDIVVAIEGPLPLYNCLKIQRKCNITENCQVKVSFQKAKEGMLEILDKTSIADFTAVIMKDENEITWLKAAV